MAPVALLLLVAGTASAGNSKALVQTKVTPVQKVIQMLTDMVAKGKAEKEDESKRFAAYKDFCKSNTVEKSHAIEDTTDEIGDLTADIAKYEEEIGTLAKQIAQHESDIAAWTTELEEATYSREKEHADFEVEHQDYTESIDSVERAIETVKAGAHDVSLVQRQDSLSKLAKLAKVPESSKRVIESFLQRGPYDSYFLELSAGAPQAKAYEEHSGGVLTMVEEMGEKMENKREEIEKIEMNAKHAYDMMAQDLNDQIETNKEAVEKKTAQKGEAGENKAQAESDLAVAKATLAEDQKFLADLTAEEEQKTVDFDKRQEVRQGEIEAIGKAIEIMSSGAIAGGTQYLPSFVQKKTTSLLQLRGTDSSSVQQHVAEFLRGRATKASSRLLSLLAVRVQADPFKKVVKMIKDMITKLMEEAEAEAEAKGFCDKEMTSNQQTRDAKSEEAEMLTAESEKLTADISQLAEEISKLGEEIAALDAMMAEATSQRETEKEKNKATIEDAKIAQAATQQATAVLKEFYDKAAGGAAMTQEKVAEAGPTGPIKYDERALAIVGGKAGPALLQTDLKKKMPGAPELEDGGYTGMGSGGVLGMLEVIESDFARLLAETTASEQESSEEYAKLKADSAADKTTKQTDVKSKTSEKTSKESALAAAKKDLAATKEELAAAMDYYEKLKPSCVDAGVSYEERVARRKEEIESLKEALNILSTE